jgi:hypothetical protein
VCACVYDVCTGRDTERKTVRERRGEKDMESVCMYVYGMYERVCLYVPYLQPCMHTVRLCVSCLTCVCMLLFACMYVDVNACLLFCMHALHACMSVCVPICWCGCLQICELLSV